jgi:hypothetical protein
LTSSLRLTATGTPISVLERLTEPLNEVEANERGTEGEEGTMDICPAFVTSGEAPVRTVEPCKSALDDPAISSELLIGFDAAAGDARRDAAYRAAGTAEDMVVGLVGMELGGPEAWSAPTPSDRLDSIEHGLQMVALVGVCRRDVDGKRDAVAVDDQMLLRSEFSAIGRVRPGRLAPPFARTLDASKLARDQSILSDFPSSSSRTRCRRSHTPATCQSLRRRQQVMPLPHPISWGRYSQPIPVRSTNKIPVSAARSSTGGRPPCGFGFAAGNSGWMRAHSASGTSGFAMGRVQYPSIPPWAKFC